MTSANHAEVMRMTSWLNSPFEGLFAVDEDRVKIAPMLEQAFSQSVKSCLIRGDILKYRILLNKQTIIMRGLPMKLDDPLPGLASFLPADDTATGSKSHLLAQFLHRNGFREVQERDGNGFSPLCYASMSGSAPLIEALLESRTSPHDKVTKHVPSMCLTRILAFH